MDILNNLKAIVSVLGLAIVLINIVKWRDFEFNRPFNNYSKRSLFAYELREKTGRKKFERLGYDFGVAAFLGDTYLEPSQRDRILEIADPVRAIESFKKCRQFIKVNDKGISLFEWKTNRYKNDTYRKVWKAVCFITYFVFMMSIPIIFIYLINFEPEFLPMAAKLFGAKLIVVLGIMIGEVLIIGIMALSKGAKITAAERLIKENLQASDMMLTNLSN